MPAPASGPSWPSPTAYAIDICGSVPPALGERGVEVGARARRAGTASIDRGRSPRASGRTSRAARRRDAARHRTTTCARASPRTPPTARRRRGRPTSPSREDAIAGGPSERRARVDHGERALLRELRRAERAHALEERGAEVVLGDARAAPRSMAAYNDDSAIAAAVRRHVISSGSFTRVAARASCPRRRRTRLRAASGAACPRRTARGRRTRCGGRRARPPSSGTGPSCSSGST